MADESAVIEAPETPAPRSPGFNTLADKFKADMDQVLKPAPVQQAPIDTAPKELPEVKKEPVKPKAEPAKAHEPAKPDEKTDEAAMFSSPNWKKLVADRDELKAKVKASTALEAQVTEYKTKLAELQTKVINPEEVETLRKERQSAMDKLERVALEQSDKFSSYYNSKFEQAMTQALDAVGKDKADQVKAILEAPKSAWRKNVLNEIIGGLDNEVDKLSLISAMNEYDKVRTERSKQLDDHKTNLSKLREVEQQNHREAQEKDVARRKEMADRVLNAAVKFEAFQEKEGDEEHNASVLKSRKLVEDFFTGAMDDATATSLPIKAAEYNRLIKLVPTLQAKVKEQEEALASYKQASPKSGDIPPGQSQEAPKSYKERVMEGLGTLGVRK